MAQPLGAVSRARNALREGARLAAQTLATELAGAPAAAPLAAAAPAPTAPQPLAAAAPTPALAAPAVLGVPDAVRGGETPSPAGADGGESEAAKAALLALKEKAKTCTPDAGATRFSDSDIRCYDSSDGYVTGLRLGESTTTLCSSDGGYTETISVPADGAVNLLKVGVSKEGLVASMTFSIKSGAGEIEATCGSGKGQTVEVLAKDTVLSSIVAYSCIASGEHEGWLDPAMIKFYCANPGAPSPPPPPTPPPPPPAQNDEALSNLGDYTVRTLRINPAGAEGFTFVTGPAGPYKMDKVFLPLSTVSNAGGTTCRLSYFSTDAAGLPTTPIVSAIVAINPQTPTLVEAALPTSAAFLASNARFAFIVDDCTNTVDWWGSATPTVFVSGLSPPWPTTSQNYVYLQGNSQGQKTWRVGNPAASLAHAAHSARVGGVRVYMRFEWAAAALWPPPPQTTTGRQSDQNPPYLPSPARGRRLGLLHPGRARRFWRAGVSLPNPHLKETNDVALFLTRTHAHTHTSRPKVFQFSINTQNKQKRNLDGGGPGRGKAATQKKRTISSPPPPQFFSNCWQ